MSAAPVRVAVLGYGYWGPNIVRTLQALPDAELAVCCDASPERLRDAQLRYGVTVVANWREVLADPAIDAVIIATPAHTPCHLQEAARGLGYGPGTLPVAERCAERVLSLPAYPGLTGRQQARVIKSLLEAAARQPKEEQAA